MTAIEAILLNVETFSIFWCFVCYLCTFDFIVL